MTVESEEDQDPDLGEPIEELLLLADTPRPGFVRRIRKSIDRRRLGSQVTGFVWAGLGAIVVELVNVLAALLSWEPKQKRERERPREPKD